MQSAPLFRPQRDSAVRGSTLELCSHGRCLVEGVVIAIDRNGIAWVLDLGPPTTLYQFVELDQDEDLARYSVKPRDGALIQPYVRAGDSIFALHPAFVAPGHILFDVRHHLELACEALNALAATGRKFA